MRPKTQWKDLVIKGTLGFILYMYSVYLQTNEYKTRLDAVIARNHHREVHVSDMFVSMAVTMYVCIIKFIE